MRFPTFRTRSREFTVALAALTAVLVLSIIVFPERAFQSSLNGLSIWWNVVFPSLLPFLMLGELMTGFGAVRGLGTLLEPLVRLLFRLPGIGGWAIAIGAVAGMPAGAETVGKLRRDNLVSREEGEALLAVSHVASPFFLFTVIGAGFLHNPATGAALAVIHYGTALLTGLLLRFRRSKTSMASVPGAADRHSLPRGRWKTPAPRERSLVARALANMHEARLEDGRSFGKLLGDSVSGAIQTLMMIGGYMIVFSVLAGVLDTIGIVRIASEFVALLAPSLRDTAETVRAVFSGLLELHIGTNRLSRLDGADVWMAAMVGAALAWSGAAVHFQVKTAIRQTDLRYRTFLVSRLVHATLAFAATPIVWKPLSGMLPGGAETSFLQLTAETTVPPADPLSAWGIWSDVPHRILVLASVVAAMALLSIIWAGLSRTAKTT